MQLSDFEYSEFLTSLLKVPQQAPILLPVSSRTFQKNVFEAFPMFPIFRLSLVASGSLVIFSQYWGFLIF